MNDTTISARFSDTENATATASRITKAEPSVTVFMRHAGSSERNGTAFLNQIPYTPGAGQVPAFTDIGTSAFWAFALNSVYPDEISDECVLTVRCEKSQKDTVRRLLFNGGGYDVKE